MLSGDKFLDQFKEDLAYAKQGNKDFRIKALENYKFYHGDQWEDGDLRVRADENKPSLTFNTIKPFIQVVVGTMIQGRGEPKFLPRQTEDSEDSEVFEEAAHWIRDQSNAKYYETKGAKDMLICGLGVTDERVSYENGIVGGTVIKERIYPLDVLFDPGACQMNLLDARFHIRVKHLTAREFEDFTGKKPQEVGVTEETPDHVADNDSTYDGDRFKSNVGRYCLYEYHYRRKEPYYWTSNPAFNPDKMAENNIQGGPSLQKIAQLENDFGLPFNTGQEDPIEVQIAKEFADRFGKSLDEPIFMMNEEEHRVLQSLFIENDLELVAKKDRKWCHYTAFISGAKVFEHFKSPVQDGFSLKFMTGDYYDDKQYFQGLVDVMMDPARYANKALSTHLHILNTTPKGGLLIEEGATDNIAELEEQYAKHDSVVTLKNGALTQGRIKEKMQPTQPSGYELIYDISQNAPRLTTGINLELLGQADRQQAGVLEATRIQQGMTVLAEFTESFSLYLKESGKNVIHFIRELTSNVDGLLYRVTGVDGKQYKRIFANQIAPYYDIIITDAPRSPNQDAEDTKNITDLLRGGVVPALPSLVRGVIEKAPIRQELRDKALMEFDQQLAGPPADPQQQALQQEAMSLEREEKIAGIREKNADAYKKQNEAAMKQVEAALKQQELRANTLLTGIG